MAEPLEFERDVKRLVRFVTRQRATETEEKSASNLGAAAAAMATTLLEDVAEMMSYKIDDERLWDLADIRPVSEQVRIADVSMSIVEAPVPLEAVNVLVDDATWRRLETALGVLVHFDFVAWGIVPAGGMPAGVVANTASSDIDLFLVGHKSWDECERTVDAVARYLHAELVRRHRTRAASERDGKRDRLAQTTATVDDNVKEKRDDSDAVVTTKSAKSTVDSVVRENENERDAASAESSEASTAETKEPAVSAGVLLREIEDGKGDEERDDEKCHDLDVRRTIGCCTFSSVREKFVIQIVLKRYASAEDVLGGFDNGSCSVALVERTGSDESDVERASTGGASSGVGDGAERVAADDEKQEATAAAVAAVVASPSTKRRGRLVTSRRGRVSYKWRTNYVDLRCRRVTFETRYLKYQERGWHLALPESCAARIRPGMQYLDMQHMTLRVDYVRENCMRTRVVCYYRPEIECGFELYCADPERCAHATHHILGVTYRDAGLQRRHALRKAGEWRRAQRWLQAIRALRSSGESASAPAHQPPPPTPRWTIVAPVRPTTPPPPPVTIVRVKCATLIRAKPRNWFLECADSDESESEHESDLDDDEDDGDTVDATVDDEAIGATAADGSSSSSIDDDDDRLLSVGVGASAPTEKVEAPESAVQVTETTSAASSLAAICVCDEKNGETNPDGGGGGGADKKEEDGVAKSDTAASIGDAVAAETKTDVIDNGATARAKNTDGSIAAAAAASDDSDDALTRPTYDVHGGYNYLAATQYQAASNYAAVRCRGAQSVYSVVACERYVLGMRCTAIQSLFTDLHLVVAKYLAYDVDVGVDLGPQQQQQQQQQPRLLEANREERREENMVRLERILGQEETVALVELLAKYPTKLEAVVAQLAQAAAATVQIPPATDRVHDAHLEALFGDLTARLFSKWCHAPANPAAPDTFRDE